MRGWSAVGLFCEDIRQEINGIETFVGVLPDNLAIPAVPGMMPKLGIYTRVHITPDFDVKKISVRVDFFNGKRLQDLGSFNEEAINREKASARETGSPLIGFIFRATISPAPVTEFGRILLWVKIDDEEWPCGGLRFVAGANAAPSDLPPPA